jgi:hypothetical protein
MKRERVEDLGRIRVLIEKLMENSLDDLHQQCNSKHTVDPFIDKYLENSEGLEELHDKIRALNDQIQEIYSIALGDDEDYI